MNPGLGAGRGAARPADVVPSLGVPVCASAAGVSKTGVATGRVSRGAAGVSVRAGGVTAGALCCGAAGAEVPCCGRCRLPGGAGMGALTGFFAGAGEPDSFSLSRLSTGASTVDEADRTNSPMSFNMVNTILLSTPSSFASS